MVGNTFVRVKIHKESDVMDNFTKKRFKTCKEFLEDAKKGKFSLRKREFDVKKSKKTIQGLSKDGKELKNKIEDLKETHVKLTDKNSDEKRDFIKSKKSKKKRK